MEYLGCIRYLTYFNFTNHVCGRYHSAHFTDEEIEAQGSQLVGISVPLGFDIGFTS